jgi:hypothetical protein
VEADATDREALLDELARCYAQAALRRLICEHSRESTNGSDLPDGQGEYIRIATRMDIVDGARHS